MRPIAPSRRLRLSAAMLLAALWAAPAVLAGSDRPGDFLRDLERRFGPAGEDPLSVKVLAEPDAATPGALVWVRLQGTVEAGNYIYSIRPQGEHSPTPTTLHVNAPWLAPAGALEESETRAAFDPVFLRTLRIHRGLFSLSRRYRVAPSAPAGRHRVRGEVRYHFCDGTVCSTLRRKAFAFSLTVAGPSPR